MPTITTGGGNLNENEAGFGGGLSETAVSIAKQLRNFIEPAEFQKTLQGRAGSQQVHCRLRGVLRAKLFPGRDERGRPTGEMVPLKHLSFNQKGRRMRDIRSNIHFREAGAAGKPSSCFR